MGVAQGRRPSRTASRPALEDLEGRRLLANIYVNTFRDLADPPAGTVSLRSAIARANAGRGHDAIYVPPGTYPETGGYQIASGRSVTVRSYGAGAKIVATPSSTDSVFVVNPGARATFIGLTISGGTGHPIGGSTAGGAIFNAGRTTVASCTLMNNTAANGGGIFNGNSLIVEDSAILANAAIRAGGGVDSIGGAVEGEREPALAIIDTLVEGNTALAGGGVENGIGLATVVRGRVAGNTSGGNGGGIDNGDELRMDDSSVLDNKAAGLGGGIASLRDISSARGLALLIRKSAIRGNTAPMGGGVANLLGPAEIAGSRVGGNIANDLADSPGAPVTLTDSVIGGA